MRILFWGTPDYAVPSLRALVGESHDVVAVVTQPDRPAGRGRELREPPVKTIARDEMIPVLQPESARAERFIAQIRDIRPEISVVVAYGQILTKQVLDIPERGSINAHASLLPALRGAAPINWAIVRGHTQTGVTVMRMAEKMDAGPIIAQAEEPIRGDETATDLWTRLSELSAELLIETLAQLENGEVTETPQDDARATFAPRITREMARIDFTASAADVANLIRGMDEIPGAWTRHRAHELKVFRPVAMPTLEHERAPGTILDANSFDAAEGILVACGAGAVSIREVQPAGKRRMTAADWLRGRGAEVGECFTR